MKNPEASDRDIKVNSSISPERNGLLLCFEFHIFRCARNIKAFL